MEYQEGDIPPNRLVERTVQVIIIVSVNGAIKAFAPVVRGLSDRVRKTLAGFHRFEIDLKD